MTKYCMNFCRQMKITQSIVEGRGRRTPFPCDDRVATENDKVCRLSREKSHKVTNRMPVVFFALKTTAGKTYHKNTDVLYKWRRSRLGRLRACGRLDKHTLFQSKHIKNRSSESRRPIFLMLQILTAFNIYN